MLNQYKYDESGKKALFDVYVYIMYINFIMGVFFFSFDRTYSNSTAQYVHRRQTCTGVRLVFFNN